LLPLKNLAEVTGIIAPIFTRSGVVIFITTPLRVELILRYRTCYQLDNRVIIKLITNLITSAMANPFFSGRIPAGLAEKIDAHLLVTRETRSELLVRLLRTEVGDRTIDDKPDNMIADLLARVEKLEQLVNNKADNKAESIIDNVVDNKSERVTEQGDNNDDNVKPDSINNKDDNKRSLALTQKELATRLGCSTITLSRAAKGGEDKWAQAMIKYPDPDRYNWRLPIETGGKLVSY
jgi:hypothetical protein